MRPSIPVPHDHYDRNNLILHCFIQWMEDEGQLDLWLKNVVLQRGNNLEHLCSRLMRSPDNALNFSMSWSVTSEGQMYWEGLHRRWKETCSAIGLHLKTMDNMEEYHKHELS